MSDKNSIKIGSLDSKIKEISDYLKSSVLDPAEEEKNKLIEEGLKEKEKIIAEAQAEAEKIVENAEKKAAILKQNTESALNIAAKQTIDKVKLALEKEILGFTVQEPVKEAMKKEDIVKDFVLEVLKQYAQSSINFTITLGENVKDKVEDFVKNEIKEKGLKGIEISGETIPSGFSLSFADNSLKIDFSEESVVELFTEYLRPELRKTLFSK